MRTLPRGAAAVTALCVMACGPQNPPVTTPIQGAATAHPAASSSAAQAASPPSAPTNAVATEEATPTGAPIPWKQGELVRVIGDARAPGAEVLDVAWLSDTTLVVRDVKRGSQLWDVKYGLVLWDTTTHVARGAFPIGERSSMAIDPKGRWVAAGGSVIRLDVPGNPSWDANADEFKSSASGDEILVRKGDSLSVLPREGGAPIVKLDGKVLYGGVRLNDGRMAFSLGRASGLRLLASADAKPIDVFTDKSLFALFSPDGKRLLAAPEEPMELWELAPDTGAIQRTVPLPTKMHDDLSFSRDGSLAMYRDTQACVAIRTSDGSVRAKLSFPGNNMLGCAISPDGTRVAGSVDPVGADVIPSKRLYVASLTEEPKARSYLLGAPDNPGRVELAPDGLTMAVTRGSFAPQTALWRLAPPRLTATNVVGLVAVGRGGVVVQAESDGELHLLDAASGKVITELPKLPSAASALAIVDGNVIAGLTEGRVAIVSIASKTLRYASRVLSLGKSTAEVIGVEPSIDGKRALLIARMGGSATDVDAGRGVLAVLDVASGVLGGQAMLEEPATNAAFDVSGKRVAAVSSHTLTVYDVGASLIQKIQKTRERVVRGPVRFADDGTSVRVTNAALRNVDITLATGEVNEVAAGSAPALSRVLGDRLAIFKWDRVFVYGTKHSEPLLLRTLTDGKDAALLAHTNSAFDIDKAALSKVPVCVGATESVWRCDFADKLGVPATPDLARDWLGLEAAKP